MENARGNDMFRGKLLSTIKAYKYNVVHGRFQKDPPPHPWTEEEEEEGGGGGMENGIGISLCIYSTMTIYTFIYEIK